MASCGFLQKKLLPTRTLIMISGFCLGVGVASLFLLSLMILITNQETTESSLFSGPAVVDSNSFSLNSSLVSWSFSLPNATLSSCCGTNVTQKVVDDGSNFRNLELKVKNVSFYRRNYSRNLGHYDTRGSFVEKGCDIFDGIWERDEKLPYYPPGSCPHIDIDFNCYLNGRPDNEFQSWRWQPKECNIPRLNASNFLERLRGKKLVFVGDSLNRNMWESLVCILRHSIQNKSRVYEVSGKREFKKEGFYAFRFEDYNCSIDYVRAPFLVKESTFLGKNGSFATLRLDLMDETTKMYRDAHVLVFNTGHWWTHDKTSKGEDYYQEGNHVHHKLHVLEAYRRALTTWGKWVDSNVDGNRTLVFFRGFSITHFRGGQWNSGGQCHRETEPIMKERWLRGYPEKMSILEEVMSKMKTKVMYLNISRLTDYRKDAHPSIYRKSYGSAKELIEAQKSQDCSHWCLPGVPDIWNQLFYASFLEPLKKIRGH